LAHHGHPPDGHFDDGDIKAKKRNCRTTLTLVLDYDGDPGGYPNNIDLFLFDTDGSTRLAASALPAGEQDSVTQEVPAGTYHVGVDIVLSPGATGGSENYVLTLAARGVCKIR
jgi:hypothetical protein